MQRGSKLLQTISAKLSECYIQTLHDMCSVIFRFVCKYRSRATLKRIYFCQNLNSYSYNTRPIKRNLMPPSISRTPDFSNQIAFPLEVREIGIPLYWVHRTHERNETYQYYVNCGHRNEMKMWSSQLGLRLKQSQIKAKNFSGLQQDSNPWPLH